MNGNKQWDGHTEMYDEYGNDISMGEVGSFIQFLECTLENMISLLNELFGSGVSKESSLMQICSDDVNKLDIIKDGVEKRFGVCITSADIVKSSNIAEFTDIVAKVKESPRFPVSEKDLRKEQLYTIAKTGNIQSFDVLVKAEKKLKNSLDTIKDIKAPINIIGYDNWFLNATQPFVTHGKLKEVVIKMDENTHDVVSNLGTAIECTNTWIDEICKMLIWIIQIENDIYGITEESASETLRLSKLLSQEGANVDNLAEVAAMEQSKRRRVQQKIKEFKSDIEGKIEFLNEVHKSLLSQFEEYKSAIDKKLESANIALEQKAGAYFNDLNVKISDSLKEYESTRQNIVDLLTEENRKRTEEFESMKSSQGQFIETMKSRIEQKSAEIDKTASSFIEDQTELANQTQKRVKLYQVISIIACAISVASIIVAIFV